MTRGTMRLDCLLLRQAGVLTAAYAYLLEIKSVMVSDQFREPQRQCCV